MARPRNSKKCCNRKLDATIRQAHVTATMRSSEACVARRPTRSTINAVNTKPGSSPDADVMIATISAPATGQHGSGSVEKCPRTRHTRTQSMYTRTQSMYTRTQSMYTHTQSMYTRTQCMQRPHGSVYGCVFTYEKAARASTHTHSRQRQLQTRTVPDHSTRTRL